MKIKIDSEAVPFWMTKEGNDSFSGEDEMKREDWHKHENIHSWKPMPRKRNPEEWGNPNGTGKRFHGHYLSANNTIATMKYIQKHADGNDIMQSHKQSDVWGEAMKKVKFSTVTKYRAAELAERE